MLFAVHTHYNTYIRYVGPDGSSMILYSFDTKRHFVNGSVSSDFRFLHLTEMVTQNGKSKYISVLYDIINTNVRSSEIQSEFSIKGEIKKTVQNVLILHIGSNLNQYDICFNDKSMWLRKSQNGISAKNVIWFHYSQFWDEFSFLSRNSDKSYLNHVKQNTDYQFQMKSIDFIDETQTFYFGHYHKTFIFIQHIYFTTSTSSQIHINFIPQNRNKVILLPSSLPNTHFNFIQYYSVIFAFIPNCIVLVIDLKDMTTILLPSSHSNMPVSNTITVFSQGIICDNRNGTVYSTTIDLDSFQRFQTLEESKALALFAASIRSWQFFYSLGFEKTKESTSSYKQKTISSDDNTYIYSNESPYINISKHESSKSANAQTSLSNELQSKLSQNADGVLIKPQLITQKMSMKNKTIIFRNVHSGYPEMQALGVDFNKVLLIPSRIAKYQRKNQSLRKLFVSQDDLNMKTFIQSPEKKFFENELVSPSSITNFNHETLNIALQNKKMFGKSVVNKFVVSTISSVLTTPYQISHFISQFIFLNREGSIDLSIPLLATFSKPSYLFLLKVPNSIKDELLYIEEYFPTRGLINRHQLFSLCVEKLMNTKLTSNLNDAFYITMKIIRKQNSLALNLQDALFLWKEEAKGFTLARFLTIFALFSEMAFYNLPQIDNIQDDINKYAMKFYTKSILEMMTLTGIYSNYLIKKNSYWAKRINKIQSPNINYGGSHKLKVHSVTIPYFPLKNRKVFQVHIHYNPQ